MNPKTIPLLALVVGGLFIATCGGGKQSAASVADKWCKMTADLKKAEGEARDKLREERKAFENEIEQKHGKDEAFMSKLKDLTRACD
jgi:cell division protein FtsB